MTADVGLIGLAVMGQNLVLNMEDHGFMVAVFNRTVSKIDDFLGSEAKNKKIIGTKTVEEFVKALKKPRVAMLMVKAGPAVDTFIETLLPYLEAGDIIIDGGNSEYLDTERRYKELEIKGIVYVGTGVSGGEEGARYGPSLMPGGNPKAWPRIKPIFEAIAAKTTSGEPCCGWTGSGGAGHFVKMVHNGIEYGDMQLIAEAYHLLREVVKLSNEEISLVFTKWNAGPLESYLIEITAKILSVKDTDGSDLIDHVLDAAQQKGTGKWTAICGVKLGSPITLITEAVFSRMISSMRDARVQASKCLPSPSISRSTLTETERQQLIENIHQALYASKVVAYAQGFMLLEKARVEYGWELNQGAIALMWREGCIIRSKFLKNIHDAFSRKPHLDNLLLDDFFKHIIAECQMGWRRTVAEAVMQGIPVPAFSSSLAFYDGIRSSKLPANLLQAQRDYFGAHQFERVENPGTYVHANWTGRGGSVSASTYQA